MTSWPDFLAFLRSYCDRVGALLIFDRIIAFRIGPNGAQGVFGVRPDLTTLGKIIGGGYALAAFGGRADVMGIFDARRRGALTPGGTFNGSPVAAAAGLATLREMTPDRYAWLDALGDRLRSRVADGFRAAGLEARIEGGGSLFQVFAGASGAAGARRPRRAGRRDPPRRGKPGARRGLNRRAPPTSAGRPGVEEGWWR